MQASCLAREASPSYIPVAQRDYNTADYTMHVIGLVPPGWVGNNRSHLSRFEGF
jgi:hypothetical protein